MSMNVQEIIDAVVVKAKEELQAYIDECKKQGKTLCDLTIDWGNPHYNSANMQLLYIIRYFYAYIMEYKHLFQYVRLDSFNVLSIGCGAYIDLLGLYLNNNQDKCVKYTGVDPAVWNYASLIKDFLPSSYEINHLVQDFDSFMRTSEGIAHLREANVIVFPKSIEYLETSLWESYIKQSEFQSPIIYLVMNAMDCDYQKDKNKIDFLSRLLKEKGYGEKYVLEKRTLIPQYYVEFSDSPKYPKDMFDAWVPQLYTQCILSKDCEKKKDCYLYNFNSPMIKTDSFQYKIYRLEKNDSQCK